MAQRIRARLRKLHDARFMSHLDLRRALQRALRRAGIPVALTQGFNPHPRFSLATALPVGAGSDAEYAEFFLEGRLGPLEFAQALSGSLPPGIEVAEVMEVPEMGPSLEAQVRAASYRVSARCDETLAPVALEKAIEDLLSMDTIPVRKREKEGRTHDARPLMHSLEVLSLDGGEVTIRMVLGVGPQGTLRPKEVMSLLSSRLEDRIDLGHIDVHREDLLLKGSPCKSQRSFCSKPHLMDAYEER